MEEAVIGEPGIVNDAGHLDLTGVEFALQYPAHARLRQVHRQRRHSDAERTVQLRSERVESSGASGDEDEVAAAPCELTGELRPDSGARARDQDRLSGVIHPLR
ncbi:hypothetical protein GCM10022225_53300 [Plantactinospora mayteni]|uniref:Uncharacterized protein n=1 Tax=Plantactinospora mayteni TaxID=566021 RepID=A0ABQ4EJK9_9ACTN|nr:hypothetical protein Pma05_15210 [Plantactinospora mayteni]